MTIQSAAAEVSALLGQFPTPERGQYRFLVTAGPTCEDIDTVRFISNRSTGRMGMFLAAEAARQGHQVLLVLGPTLLDPPPGLKVVDVRSAREMQVAVQGAFEWCDVLLMSAAVADYEPETACAGKIHKTPDDLVLRLVRTPDILESLKNMRMDQVVVGFSLDTVIDTADAVRKRDAKDLDMIVANTQHAFGGLSTDAVLIERGADPAPVNGTKEALAEELVRRSVDRAKRIRARRSASDRFAARKTVQPEE